MTSTTLDKTPLIEWVADQSNHTIANSNDNTLCISFILDQILPLFIPDSELDRVREYSLETIFVINTYMRGSIIYLVYELNFEGIRLIVKNLSNTWIASVMPGSTLQDVDFGDLINIAEPITPTEFEGIPSEYIMGPFSQYRYESINGVKEESILGFAATKYNFNNLRFYTFMWLIAKELKKAK